VRHGGREKIGTLSGHNGDDRRANRGAIARSSSWMR
jgi:hypothetical protein